MKKRFNVIRQRVYVVKHCNAAIVIWISIAMPLYRDGIYEQAIECHRTEKVNEKHFNAIRQRMYVAKLQYRRTIWIGILMPLYR
jgi:hypothetical protein